MCIRDKVKPSRQTSFVTIWNAIPRMVAMMPINHHGTPLNDQRLAAPGGNGSRTASSTNCTLVSSMSSTGEVGTKERQTHIQKRRTRGPGVSDQPTGSNQPV